MTASLRLSYGGATVDVSSADPAPLRWLDEFLSPWFTGPARGTAHATVRLTADPDRLASLRRDVTATGAPVDCFVLDTRVVRHPAVEDRAGGRTIADLDLGVAYRVGADRSTIEIVVPADGPGARVALMRVVRELATGYATRHGGLLLHAGAVETGGRAVVLAGPKESGKTTLLLHLLHTGGARFAANDRVVVEPGASPAVRGMPSIVAVRPGTLDRLPALRERLRAGPATHWLTGAEVRALGDHGPLVPGAGADLSPAQLCGALGVTATSGGVLAAVVFPRVAPTRRDVELVPLPVEVARARLTTALFGPAPGPRSAALGWLGGDDAGGDEPRSAERCRVLATAVPFFEARLGGETLDDASAAAACLGALLS